MSARDRIASVRRLLETDAAGGISRTILSALVDVLDDLAEENERLRERLAEHQSAIDDLNDICVLLDDEVSDIATVLDFDAEKDGGEDEHEDVDKDGDGFSDEDSLGDAGGLTCSDPLVPDAAPILPLHDDERAR